VRDSLTRTAGMTRKLIGPSQPVPRRSYVQLQVRF